MSEAYSTEPDTTQEDSQLQLHSQHGRFKFNYRYLSL